MTQAIQPPKFLKPKILLVDLPPQTGERLSAEGFNVLSGTFGRQYRANDLDNYLPVFSSARLPNHAEQELIILDLSTSEVSARPEGERQIGRDEPFVFAQPRRGIIDPRPWAMVEVCNDWDRVLGAGGLFVMFAQPRLLQQVLYGSRTELMIGSGKQLNVDNWSFLSIFHPDFLEVTPDRGNESEVVESKDFVPLSRFFSDRQNSLVFQASLEPLYLLKNRFEFFPLCFNKFGNCIGGAIVAKGESGGRVLILPHFRDKEGAVYDLVTTVLPEMSLWWTPFFGPLIPRE